MQPTGASLLHLPKPVNWHRGLILLLQLGVEIMQGLRGGQQHREAI